MDRAALRVGIREGAFGVPEGDPGLLGFGEPLGLAAVVRESGDDLLVDAVERRVGPVARGGRTRRGPSASDPRRAKPRRTPNRAPSAARLSPSFAFLDPDFATWPGAVYAGASARVFSPKRYGDAFETDIHASGGEPDRAFTLGAARWAGPAIQRKSAPKRSPGCSTTKRRPR